MVGLDFFAREQTSPPTVTLAVWVGLVLLAASIVLVCYRYRNRFGATTSCGLFGPGNLTVDDIQWLRDITQSRIEAGLY